MKIIPKSLTSATAVFAAVTLAVGLAACGSSSKSTTTSPSGKPGAGKPAVTLGDKNFTEEYILGDLYAQALQAKGFTVNIKSDIGSSEITDTALTSGQIDLYPEYSGVIYSELAKLGDTPPSAPVTYQGAVKWEAGRGFTYLQPTPFQDADRVATTKAYAQAHNLKSMGDLKSLPSFTYGGPPENATRFQGVLGMQQAYGLTNTQFVPLPIGSQYQALDAGKVNTIAIFTTDGQLTSNKYTVLDDPKGIFGFQQVAPVVSNKVLAAEGPAFQQTLNAVSAKLTDQAIQIMNEAVGVNQQDAATVAGQFLTANGLK
ncbi:MAG: glycine betaine ABC transporter substrate-binding protein [Acidimicrobiales bacterium]